MARRSVKDPARKMSIMGHIQELQTRLVVSAIFLIATATTAYMFKDNILTILLKPLDGQKLMYLNPAGGFSFILMVSLYAGIAFSSPIVLHQLYCFVRPALSANVQKKSFQILVSSSLLLLSGVLFGYFFAIPGALQFLNEFAGTYVNASLTADSYLHFIVAYTLGLGLVFQLPLLLMLIHWIKPLTPTGLLKSERWVIVLSFVAAAIITPTPDPLNQTIIALPIVFVYQLGVVAVLMNIYRSRRALRRSERAALKHHTVKKDITTDHSGSPTPPTVRTAPMHPAIQVAALTTPLSTRPIKRIDAVLPGLRNTSRRIVPAPIPTIARPLTRSVSSTIGSMDGIVSRSVHVPQRTSINNPLLAK